MIIKQHQVQNLDRAKRRDSKTRRQLLSCQSRMWNRFAKPPGNYQNALSGNASTKSIFFRPPTSPSFASTQPASRVYRWYSAPNSQSQETNQQKQHPGIDNFIKSVQSKSPRDAITVYKTLSRFDLVRELAYWDLHQYVILLCNQLNRVSSSFSLPPKLLSNLVGQVVVDIRQHPKRYQLSETLYPILMRFYIGAGKTEDALALANEMQEKNIPHTIASITSLIICYEKLRRIEDCIQLYNQAQQQFQNQLGDQHDKFVLERTMIKVFGHHKDIDEAEKLMKQVLSRPQVDAQITSLVHLAFLDACVAAGDSEKFVKTLESLKKDGLEQQNIGHVFLGFAKLGKLPEMWQYMQEAHGRFQPFDGQFAPKSDDPVSELLDKSIETRRTGFSASTFSDVLYSLSDRVKSAVETNAPESTTKEIVGIAENVFDLYEQQVVDTLERFKAIGDQLKFESEEVIFKRPRNPTLRVLKVPYLQLYSIVMRNNSVYLAMARVHLESGREGAVDSAMEIVKRGSIYHGYGENQLINLFGEEKYRQYPDLQALCSGSRVVSG